MRFLKRTVSSTEPRPYRAHQHIDLALFRPYVKVETLLLKVVQIPCPVPCRFLVEHLKHTLLADSCKANPPVCALHPCLATRNFMSSFYSVTWVDSHLSALFWIHHFPACYFLIFHTQQTNSSASTSKGNTGRNLQKLQSKGVSKPTSNTPLQPPPPNPPPKPSRKEGDNKVNIGFNIKFLVQMGTTEGEDKSGACCEPRPCQHDAPHMESTNWHT